jgi:hypothetical protein
VQVGIPVHGIFFAETAKEGIWVGQHRGIEQMIET